MFWTKLKQVGNRIFRIGCLSILLLWLGMGNANKAIAAPSAFQLGSVALHQQQYELAVQYFDQAVNQKQRLDEAYGYQCFALLMLNEPMQAHQSCKRALAISPNHSQAIFYNGLALYRLDQFDAAIAAFTRHISLHAEDARAYYNRGLAQFAKNDVMGAIAQYHQALTYAAGLTTLEMSSLYNDLGVAYWLNDKSNEAKFALDQAVTLNENDARAHFNRGCICHSRGEYALALDEFAQVLTINPHHAETYLNRGLVNQHLRNAQAAIQDYQAAFKHFQQQGKTLGAQKAKLHLQRLQHPYMLIG